MEPLDLGSNVFLHKPHPSREEAQIPQGQDKTRAAPPALVILCTWQGGATTRRIAKYVSGYQQLYPTASILVIRTELADMVYRTLSTIRARLKPARDVVTGTLVQPIQGAGPSNNNKNNNPSVLLHMFSHGGCNIAIQLVASLPRETRALFDERLRLVVADCCPGDGTFEETYRAGLLSLPPEMPFRPLGRAGLYGTVSVVYALHRAGMMKSVPDLREDLNDPRVFSRRARRLYLLSDGDAMILAKDVALHARSAEKSGYKVSLVRFNHAVHCSLVLEDPAKYWGAIRDSWAEGTTTPPLPKL